jgi:hypothetical protein
LKLIGAFCGFGNVPKKEYRRKEVYKNTEGYLRK